MDDLSPEHAALLRSMDPEQRWAIWRSLFRTVRNLQRAAVQAAHPDWTTDEIEREVARRILHARA